MKHWPWMAAMAVFCAVRVGLMLLEPRRTNDADSKVDSFSADLAFIFDCKGKADPPSDPAIERVLKDKAFCVLNKLSLAREQHMDYSGMKMDIIGKDGVSCKVVFMSTPEEPTIYRARLDSEPPTHHSANLGAAPLGFTENTRRWTRHQIARHENAADAKDIYDFDPKQTEGWYQQAAEMQGSEMK